MSDSVFNAYLIPNPQPHLTGEVSNWDPEGCTLLSGGTLGDGGAGNLAVESPPLTSVPPT